MGLGGGHGYIVTWLNGWMVGWLDGWMVTIVEFLLDLKNSTPNFKTINF